MSTLLTDAMAVLTSRLDFASLLDQRGRMLQLHSALPALALIPEKMVLREAVGQPYEMLLDCLSTSRHFELKGLVGEQLTVALLQPDGRYAPWHGYVFEAAQLGADGGLARYRLTMRPWLSMLARRHDSRAWQDKTALQIVEEIFADYPEASWRVQAGEPLRQRSMCIQYAETDLAFVARLLAEEGMSWRIEQLSGQAAADADRAGHARHTMLITDRSSEPGARPALGTLRYTSQHVTARLPGQRDAITAFMARRTLTPGAVTLGSWNHKTLAGTTAQAQTALDLGDIPRLEIYDGSGAYRYENNTHAERAAALALAAIELDIKGYEGQGSVRHLSAGGSFQLIDHPLFGANTSALNYTGAPIASHQRPDNEFVVLAVEHHASNNLGAQVAQLLKTTELERGTYKNHFHAAPAAAAVVPRQVRKPTAPGAQAALVVGVQDQPLTTDRDLRVRIQFPWQRGRQPLTGGLQSPSTAHPDGNAPGNERSLAWVRVAMPSAGANWGSAFVPRIGTEVAVQFIEGDVDRPVIAGQLHNGQDAPPFPAGQDSGANHPGVISGLHSQALDGQGSNQWVLDDATGQLRMRLLSTTSTAQLGLGHLIQQPAAGAQRGPWRGEGFELTTDGWASLRAGRGLLISTSQRPGTYGSAQGGQMDATEAVAQLKASQNLGQRLHDAARQSQAAGLHSHTPGQALNKLIAAIDPHKDGKHTGPVNGQAAVKTSDGRQDGSEPVETFAQPLIVLDSPASAALASQASVLAMSGQSTSLAAQGDLHQAAAHTWASVSGQTTSFYTHTGGIHAKAANGNVSLRAHTDQLQIWADRDITVISVNDEVRISASSKIELIGGQSSLVLEGGNVTFSCPGNFQVKGGSHAFLGGGSKAAELPALPVGKLGAPPRQIEVTLHDDALKPMSGYPYRIVFASGSTLQGRLNAQGYAKHLGVPDEWANVYFGDSPNPAVLKPVSVLAVTDQALSSELEKLGLKLQDLQALVDRESGRSA